MLDDSNSSPLHELGPYWRFDWNWQIISIFVKVESRDDLTSSLLKFAYNCYLLGKLIYTLLRFWNYWLILLWHYVPWGCHACMAISTLSCLFYCCNVKFICFLISSCLVTLHSNIRPLTSERAKRRANVLFWAHYLLLSPPDLCQRPRSPRFFWFFFRPER